MGEKPLLSSEEEKTLISEMVTLRHAWRKEVLTQPAVQRQCGQEWETMILKPTCACRYFESPDDKERAHAIVRQMSEQFALLQQLLRQNEHGATLLSASAYTPFQTQSCETFLAGNTEEIFTILEQYPLIGQWVEQQAKYVDSLAKSSVPDSPQAKAKWIRSVGELPASLAEKNRRIQNRYRAWQEKRKTFISANLRLVVSIAKRYVSKKDVGALLDAIENGNIGLMRACDLFDLGKECRFSTYATWWIRQTIGRDLKINRMSSGSRVPLHLSETLEKARGFEKEFMLTHSRRPKVEEIAEGIHTSLETLRSLFAHEHAWSIDTPLGNVEEENMYDLLEDQTTENPVELADNEGERKRRAVQNALETLDDREREIVKLRFGMKDGYAYTLEETARLFGLTRERVRQIEAKALKQLRTVAVQHSIVSTINGRTKRDTHNPFTQPISSLGLESRYSVRLRGEGITTVEELMSTSKEELEQIPYLGQMFFGRIETLLRSKNIFHPQLNPNGSRH